MFDLSERLRMRGWQVPAYTFPENLTDMAVMRIVVRNGFSMDLANLLLDDVRLHVPDARAPPANPAAAGDPGHAAVVQALARSSTSSFKH